MKSTKKLLMLIAAVTALMLCFAFGVSAEAYSGTCGENAVWNFDSASGTLTISGTGDMYDYTGTDDVPWYGAGHFPWIKAVVIEEGITSIGDYNFCYCYNMQSVSIPDTVTQIGLAAFSMCFNLKAVELPENLQVLESVCFVACTSLKEIIIPESVTAIPGKCFGLCYNLKKIVLHDNIETIGERVFEECFLLSEVTIGKNVSSVGENAFKVCPVLENIYVYNTELDLTASCLGKQTFVVEGYDFCEFWETYAQKLIEYATYFDDVRLGVKSSESDIAYFESLEAEVQEMNDCIAYLDSTDYIISDLLTIHGYSGSTAQTYATENSINFAEIIDSVTLTDESTKVQAEYESTVFDGEVKLVISETPINANYVFVSLFSKFAPYDISFEINGEKVQPRGDVTVKIPLPDGYNSLTTFVYYVDDSGNITKLDSTYADGYVIFVTDHFSEYVLVDESSKIEEPSTDEPTTEPETPSENSCECKCHSNGFMNFIYKIINFFRRIFGMGNCCVCF